MTSIILDDFKVGMYITLHYLKRNFAVYKILEKRSEHVWRLYSYSSVVDKFHRVPVGDFSGETRKIYKSQINEIFKLELSKHIKNKRKRR